MTRTCRFSIIIITAVFLFTVPQGRGIAPDAGYRPAGTEIVELRDAFSRHISNGDGTITAEISSRPIHVLNNDSHWIPIVEESPETMLTRPDQNGVVGEMDVEILAETFEYPFATGHCAYDGTNYAKNDMGLIKVEREIVIYPASFEDRVGWMRFDVASIPDDATVTWVQCEYIVVYFELSMGLAFTCLDDDPVPTGAQTLYDAIWNSEVCAMGNREAGVVLWDLGTIAADHIQEKLTQDWVAFGIAGYNYSGIVSKRTWIIGWNVNPREDAPQLFIT